MAEPLTTEDVRSCVVETLSFNTYNSVSEEVAGQMFDDWLASLGHRGASGTDSPATVDPTAPRFTSTQ